MKILIIPDVHGNWTETIKFIEDNKGSVDKVVTLGDYVDDFDEKLNGENMINGFKKLCELKRAEPEKFNICIGNHDLSYISNPHVSGHHWEYALDYRKMFFDNIDIMDIIVKIDDWYFSHAGVSEKWYNFFVKGAEKNNKGNYFRIIPAEEWEEVKGDPVKEMNKLFHSGFFKLFDYCSEAGDWGDGNSPLQGPLWIRPPSLIPVSLFDKQVIGHTETYLKEPIPVLSKEGKTIVLTDTRGHDNYIVLDTENPWETIPFEELNKFVKKRMKEINDEKSREGQKKKNAEKN
mgnify:CR=1 FL=1